MPIDQLDPNATIHWQWHSDASPIDPMVVDGTREAALLVDKAVSPSPVQSAPRPGRNELCYCGSGRKFKKCHGGN